MHFFHVRHRFIGSFSSEGNQTMRRTISFSLVLFLNLWQINCNGFYLKTIFNEGDAKIFLTKE
jgi:hypothetical protein